MLIVGTNSSIPKLTLSSINEVVTIVNAYPIIQ